MGAAEVVDLVVIEHTVVVTAAVSIVANV